MRKYNNNDKKYVQLTISVSKEYDQSIRDYIANNRDSSIDNLQKLINVALSRYALVSITSAIREDFRQSGMSQARVNKIMDECLKKIMQDPDFRWM